MRTICLYLRLCCTATFDGQAQRPVISMGSRFTQLLEFSMALTADQILAAQKANLETLFGLTT